MTTTRANRWPARLALIALAVLAVAGWQRWQAAQAGTLIVYCSHDSIFAEAVLREFQKRSGFPVAVRYDTEATKSLGLVELLRRERNAPRCDVFWNGELLGTEVLAREGILQPYRGANFGRIPVPFRDDAGLWIGFAARLRVWIYAPRGEFATNPAATISARWRDRDLSRIAIARPLYGTTLTHYAALWDLWGSSALQDWHSRTRAVGLREVNGNAAVKDAVASGACDFGGTDTDDFFAARDAGAAVAMLPVWLEDGTTLCIPNTVAIIRGTPRLAAAQQLVDFLTSADAELMLARSAARQIPLGPVPPGSLPADVSDLQAWAAQGHDLRRLLPARDACLAWLKSLADE